MAEVKYLNENGLSTVWSKVKGIVTPKADKVSGATAGHLAGLNSGGNLVDSGLAADNIAQKNGSYSGMTVGAAEDLVSEESVASEFTHRVTGGSTAVGKGGTALVDKIKGRTLVWNQLVRNGNFADGTEYWAPGVATTLTVSNNTVRVTANANEISNMAIAQFIDTISGHQYLVKLDITSHNKTGDYYSGYLVSPTQWLGSVTIPAVDTKVSYSQIITANNNRTRIMFGLYRYGQASYFANGDYCEYSNIMLIDLTLMFGAGSEPATPEEFEALYPLSYYDYNPGTLISNAATAIETVGWNIWDEEVETGGIDTSTGENTSGSNRLRSASFTPIIGGESYYMYCGSGAYAVGYFYDKNKQFISYLGAGSFSNKAFSAPGSAHYLRIALGQNYGTAYQNDICISLSDTSRNGTYEPYWRSELDLNIPTLTGKLNGTGNSIVIFPDGLRSAGTVYDEIVGNKAIKRIGAVDMGSLTWTYAESAARFYSSVLPAAATTGYNCICTKYRGSSASDLAIFIGNNNRVYVYDSAYTDAAIFKDSLSGVTLYYELATHEEYILDEAIPTAMRNDPYGTERRLPEDTAAIVTAPFRADITYSTNIKEAVQSLPQNYINVNSMQDFLAALGAQMGGTWTMRPADGKFDFTFTPNPVEPTL